MKDERVLIDTSAWISYFRNTDDKLTQRIDDILAFSEVCLPRVVIAELVQGAKTEKEIEAIEELAEAFIVLDQTEDTWLKAGRLSFSMKRKGITVHLVDCYVAVLANENGCKILTLDEHFKSIKKFIELDLL